MAATERKLLCPGQKAIAFAISVVQSKPPELTMCQYIRHLRRHVSKGRRENALSSTYRHLDRSAFWRSEHDRATSALKASEQEAVQLRLEIETLKAKVEKLKANAPAKKRKKQDIDTIPVPRSPKRAKRESSPTRAIPSLLDFSAEHAEYHESGKIGNTLLQSVYVMLSASKSHHKTDAEELVPHLMSATSAIPGIMEREIKRIITEHVSDNDQLTSALNVGTRAIGAIFFAYGKICHGPDSPRFQGQATYTVVTMFQTLLQEFEVLSLNELESAASNDRESAPEPSASKSKGKAKPSKPTNIKPNSRLGLYTNFLANIIDKLDPKVATNRDIYEGFAYCLLKKLGSHLYTSTFGDPRPGTIEDEILQHPQEDGAGSDGAQAEAAQKPFDREKEQIRLEAPYLIHLLTRLMLAAPFHLGACKGRRSNAKSATKTSLAVLARERLQRTLVNCVFGVEGQDQEDLFSACLKLPKAPPETIQMPRIKEPEVQNWFQDELWRILGWEILAREDGL